LSKGETCLLMWTTKWREATAPKKETKEAKKSRILKKPIAFARGKKELLPIRTRPSKGREEKVSRKRHTQCRLGGIWGVYLWKQKRRGGTVSGGSPRQEERVKAKKKGMGMPGGKP